MPTENMLQISTHTSELKARVGYHDLGPVCEDEVEFINSIITNYSFQEAMQHVGPHSDCKYYYPSGSVL